MQGKVRYRLYLASMRTRTIGSDTYKLRRGSHMSDWTSARTRAVGGPAHVTIATGARSPAGAAAAGSRVMTP
jgi:hypothetical protein